EMRDRPDNPPYYTASFEIQAGSERIELRRPVHYRFIDPERGERVRPVAIVPPVVLNLTEPAFVFPNGKPQRVELQVKANVARAAGDVRLEVDGWKVEPPSRAFRLTEVGEQADLSFDVTPSPRVASATVRAIAKVGGKD